MLFRAIVLPLALIAFGAAAETPKVQDPAVGGAQMYPSKTVLDNLKASGDHGRYVAAVEAAGMDGALAGPGPFTVFAATDGAFETAGLAAGDQAELSKVVNCNRMTGLTSVAQLAQLAGQNGGTYALKTLGGCILTARVAADGGVTLTDENGASGRITTGDVNQQNGVVHVVDTVFLPKT